MAEIMTFTPEQQQEFDTWLAGKPPAVQAVVKEYPPTKLYRNTVGQRVFIMSYEENRDGSCTTCTVAVTAKYNKIAFERNVFGVPLKDLTECDLPTKDEELGAVFTDPKEVDAFIDITRPAVLAAREKNDAGRI